MTESRTNTQPEANIVPNRFERRWNSSSINGEFVYLAIVNLQCQIETTMPACGLSHTLGDLALESKKVIHTSEKKSLDWTFEWFIPISISIFVFFIFWQIALALLDNTAGFNGFDDVDAAVNLVFLSVMTGYLIKQVLKNKRRAAAMKQLHRIRSLVHVLDMKQQNKKYHNICLTNKRPLTPLENIIYLDSCSQALALTGKVAALLIEGHNDTVVIATVSEIDGLSNGISTKIWHKIAVLQAHVNEK